MRGFFGVDLDLNVRDAVVSFRRPNLRQRIGAFGKAANGNGAGCVRYNGFKNRTVCILCICVISRRLTGTCCHAVHIIARVAGRLVLCLEQFDYFAIGVLQLELRTCKLGLRRRVNLDKTQRIGIRLCDMFSHIAVSVAPDICPRKLRGIGIGQRRIRIGRLGIQHAVIGELNGVRRSVRMDTAIEALSVVPPDADKKG